MSSTSVSRLPVVSSARLLNVGALCRRAIELAKHALLPPPPVFGHKHAIAHTVYAEKNYAFYPRDAMLARVIGRATCSSVCLSVRRSVCYAPVLCQNEES